MNNEGKPKRVPSLTETITGVDDPRKIRILAYGVSGRIVSDTFLIDPAIGRGNTVSAKGRWVMASRQWIDCVTAVQREDDSEEMTKRLILMAGCSAPGYPREPGTPWRHCKAPANCLFCYARWVGEAFTSVVRASSQIKKSHLSVRYPMAPEIKRSVRRYGFLGAVSTSLPIFHGKKRSAVVGLVPSTEPTPYPEVIADYLVKVLAFPYSWINSDHVRKTVTDRLSDRVYSFSRHGLCRSSRSEGSR